MGKKPLLSGALTASPSASAPGEMEGLVLQGKVEGLTEAQFEKLLFRLRVRQQDLSSKYAPLTARSIELIRLLQQDPRGLERLSNALLLVSPSLGGPRSAAKMQILIRVGLVLATISALGSISLWLLWAHSRCEKGNKRVCEELLAAYRPICSLGWGEACFQAGFILFRGPLSLRSSTEADEKLGKACHDGHGIPDACFFLGESYKNVNVEKALEAYIWASTGGNETGAWMAIQILEPRAEAKEERSLLQLRELAIKGCAGKSRDAWVFCQVLGHHSSDGTERCKWYYQACEKEPRRGCLRYYDSIILNKCTSPSHVEFENIKRACLAGCIDTKNKDGCRCMGDLLLFREKKCEEAAKWYEKECALDRRQLCLFRELSCSKHPGEIAPDR